MAAPPPYPDLAALSAAVLCGGRSLRFGSDKALARVGGRSLVDRVVDSLASAHEILLVGRDYPLAGVRHVADVRQGAGPLAGLEAALEAARGPWVAVAACDLPCLTPEFWQLLSRHAADAGAEAVAVRDDAGRFEPLAALYLRTLLPRVRARLDAGERDLQGLLLDLHGVGALATVSSAEVETACGSGVLRNVNRPDDLSSPDDACGERGAGEG